MSVQWFCFIAVLWFCLNAGQWFCLNAVLWFCLNAGQWFCFIAVLFDGLTAVQWIVIWNRARFLGDDSFFLLGGWLNMVAGRSCRVFPFVFEPQKMTP